MEDGRCSGVHTPEPEDKHFVTAFTVRAHERTGSRQLDSRHDQHLDIGEGWPRSRVLHSVRHLWRRLRIAKSILHSPTRVRRLGGGHQAAFEPCPTTCRDAIIRSIARGSEEDRLLCELQRPVELRAGRHLPRASLPGRRGGPARPGGHSVRARVLSRLSGRWTSAVGCRGWNWTPYVSARVPQGAPRIRTPPRVRGASDFFLALDSPVSL